MKKFIKKIIYLVVICAMLIIPVNYLMKNNDGRYIYRMMNEMYNCEQNIDVLFLGSSHVFRCYDTTIADEILGMKTYNAGSASQGMNTSYFLLKEICEYHDVKRVFLDTYYGIANIPENDSQVYTVSDYMRIGKNKTDLLLSNGGLTTLFSGYITANRGSYNIVRNVRSNFSPIDDYSSVSFENEEYRGEGFVYSFETCDSEDDNIYKSYAGSHDLSAECPVSELYEEYLLKIIEYCKENNIELVLVNQPMPRKTTDYVLGYENYVNYIRAIADESGIMYLNFDLYKGDMGLTMADYSDGGHLNGQGAEKYTEFFCNLIIDYDSGLDISDSFRDYY